MNKGKSVCERTAIRRELLEGFVIDKIMDSLPFSKSATRLEEMIREYLNGHDRKHDIEDSTEKRLQEIDRKMQNLLDAVERGIGLETVLARLKELENEKKVVEQDRSRVTIPERYLDPKETSSQAAQFFVGFRKRFDKAPIEEKKPLLQAGGSRGERKSHRKGCPVFNNKNPDGEPGLAVSTSAIGFCR